MNYSSMNRCEKNNSEIALLAIVWSHYETNHPCHIFGHITPKSPENSIILAYQFFHLSSSCWSSKTGKKKNCTRYTKCTGQGPKLFYRGHFFSRLTRWEELHSRSEAEVNPWWWVSGDVNVALLRIYASSRMYFNITFQSWFDQDYYPLLADFMVMSFYFSTADLSYNWMSYYRYYFYQLILRAWAFITWQLTCFAWGFGSVLWVS
jgi:hypothetical protein